MSLIFKSFLVAFLVFPSVGMSQVWKEIGPDGKVTYSNSPSGMRKPVKMNDQPTSAVSVDTSSYSSTPSPSTPSPPPITESDSSKQDQERSSAAKHAMEEKLSQARTELAAARKNAETGAAPLDGERQKTVSGSRLSDSFFSRQEMLKSRVELLERNVRELESKLSAMQ